VAVGFDPNEPASDYFEANVTEVTLTKLIRIFIKEDFGGFPFLDEIRIGAMAASFCPTVGGCRLLASDRVIPNGFRYKGDVNVFFFPAGTIDVTVSPEQLFIEATLSLRPLNFFNVVQIYKYDLVSGSADSSQGPYFHVEFDPTRDPIPQVEISGYLSLNFFGYDLITAVGVIHVSDDELYFQVSTKIAIFKVSVR
jgi:hypothetical protein